MISPADTVLLAFDDTDSRLSLILRFDDAADDSAAAASPVG